MYVCIYVCIYIYIYIYIHYSIVYIKRTRMNSQPEDLEGLS